MKTKKVRDGGLKWICGLSAAMLITAGTAVQAESFTQASPELEASRVQITGNADSGLTQATVVVTPGRVQADAVDMETPFVYINGFRTTGNSFSVPVSMPKESVNGIYTALTTMKGQVYTDTFYYLDMNQVSADVINALTRAASAGQMAATLRANQGALGLEAGTDFDSVATEYFRFSNPKLSVGLRRAVAQDALEKAASPEALTRLLGKYQNLLEIADEDLSQWSDDVSKEIFRIAMLRKDELSSYAAQFHAVVALARLNCESAPGRFEKLLFEEYSQVLGLDASKVRNCGNPEQAIKDLMGTRYDTVVQLQRGYEDVIKRYPKTNTSEPAGSSPSRGGGRSSGGSGGGGGTAGNSMQFEMDNDTYTQLNQPIQAGFSDLSASHWAYTAVMALYNDGIVNGFGDGTFLPEQQMTRAEYAKMADKAFFGAATADPVSFLDVAEGAWYYESVTRLAGLHILQGDPAGSFHPDANISRQDMAVMMYRCIQSAGLAEIPQANASPFSDRDAIADYATEAVDVLWSMGILNGREDNQFQPEGYLTRAEAAKCVYEIKNLNRGGIDE